MLITNPSPKPPAPTAHAETATAETVTVRDVITTAHAETLARPGERSGASRMSDVRDGKLKDSSARPQQQTPDVEPKPEAKEEPKVEEKKKGLFSFFKGE